MSTQRTRIRNSGASGAGSEPPQQDESDLGIPENVSVQGDPNSAVTTASPRVVFGRQMRPVSPEDLERAHRAYAGAGVDMLGASISRRNDKQEEPPIVEPSIPQPSADDVASAQREARRIMPEVFRAQPQAQQVAASQPSQPVMPPRARQQQASVLSQPDDAVLPPQMGDAEAAEAATAFEFLAESEARAIETGNYEAAAQAHALATKLKERFNVRQTSAKKERHPALQKLLQNLGLERIKNVEVPWGGSVWMFGPANARLDKWVSNNTTPDGSNIGALLVSASVLALDGVPIYKIVGLSAEQTFDIAPHDNPDAVKSVKIRLYKKQCSCGEIVLADAESCQTCGALLDPFDIPIELRLDCAKAFYNILEDKFGAYEDLINLVELRDTVMKDRRFHKDDLYPLLKPSPKPETTQE